MSTTSTLSTARLPSHCMCKFAPQKQLISALVKCPSALGSARNICKTFGLKATQSFKASMATYKVKLICEDQSEHEFEAPDDCYILDSAENAGVELLTLAGLGLAVPALGKLAKGTVDQSDGSFLDEKQMEEGYLLTCVSYPTSDCVIHTHKETELY